MQTKADVLREVYAKMLRIRMVEEKIAELYGQQEMRCPVHLSIGQEAVAVGASEALRKNDLVVSNHRAHAHYLAKGGHLKSMIAEIYLRSDGCCRGRGGSMHLNDRSAGLIGAVPIVSASIPIAVGTAFKARLKGEDTITLIFMGEAATEEGVFYESVNFAALKRLPVIFLCENNLYSVYSPLSVRVPEGRDTIKLVDAMGIPGYQGDGNDVWDVLQKTREAVERVRAGDGPYYLEFSTYRWREHCGPNYDNHIGYRTENEFNSWKRIDPLPRCRQMIAECDPGAPVQFQDIEVDITEEIEEAFRFAMSSPFPDPESLLEGVYAG